MSGSNRVHNIVTAFFISLFIQCKYDSELVGDSEVTKFKKNKYGCQLWELVISTSSRQDVLLLLLAK